jgi:hypothetical protein
MNLSLYSVFHLNLLFSSIPESDRSRVIERCYWPLLRLIEDSGASIAIEATAYTLEEIQRIDPSWVDKFRELLASGKTELLGSGYAQVVGPVVPAEVTAHNLAIGNEVYESLVGVRPRIGYLDEQTYSASLVPLYVEAGYEAVVMEWNNAVRYQKDWDVEMRYKVVRAKGTGTASIPVIWNNSIAFQKFQRYAHAETALPEYLSYLNLQKGSDSRIFSLYGNDAEIFDFRPGRYKTEAVLDELHEWDRISTLYKALADTPEITQAHPSTVLDAALQKGGLPEVSLETPEQPIVVKKQEKYNLSRWALTGRDSITINTKCYQIYEALMTQGTAASSADWKALCYAWDSDFRTHITKDRFDEYLSYLEILSQRVGAKDIVHNEEILSEGVAPIVENNLFTISTPKIKVTFNSRRGLSIESLIFTEISEKSLLGTVLHGHFDHVPFNADFYTGNTVIDIPAKMRATDLSYAKDVLVHTLPSHNIVVTGNVSLGEWWVEKRILIDIEKGELEYSYAFNAAIPTPSVVHTGLLTINPDAFDRHSLFYACHNGGREAERFPLKDTKEILETPVSLFVSSRNVLGNTTGVLSIGDKDKYIEIKTDMSKLATLPFVAFTDIDHTYFLRAGFSIAEFDDTTALREGALLPQTSFCFTVRARS